MPSANYPGGFSPAAYRAGNSWNEQANLYWIPSSDTNQYVIGDLVTIATGSDPDGVPAVQRIVGGTGNGSIPGAVNLSSGANVPLGAIVGIRIADPGLSLQGPDLTLALIQIPPTGKRATGYYVYVCDDPDIIFEIPTDGLNSTSIVTVTNGVPTFTAANKNCSYTVNGPATTNSPYSGTVLNTGSIATTNTLPLKIIGVPVRPDNSLLATYTNAAPLRVRVMFNAHIWFGQVGGV